LSQIKGQYDKHIGFFLFILFLG